MSNPILVEPVETHPLLTERWSPRSFHQAHEISDASLSSLLEAARWAPSANNVQPWRYVVAKRGDAAFAQITAALAATNQVWAQHASALIVAIALDTQANPYALYDLGQSVTHLSIQAHAIGYHTHQMGGFDREALGSGFNLPVGAFPAVVVAIGEAADASLLSEHLREREVKPRQRLPLTEIVLNWRR